MNILDFIIIIIIAGSVLRGYQLGLIRQLVNLFGFIIAIFIAYQFSSSLAPFLSEYIPAPSFDNPTLYMFSQTLHLENMFYNAIAFIILFIGIKLLLNFGGAILHQIANLPVLATINRFSGALIGFIQAVVLVIIIIHVITVMPWQQLQQYTQDSVISVYLMNLTPVITELLYEIWNSSF